MRLEIVTGPMFCGKSEQLHRRMRIAAYARLNILLLKPKLDNRGARDIFQFVKDDKKLSGYKNLKALAMVFNSKKDLGDNLNLGLYDLVAVDEAQFLGVWFKDFLAKALLLNCRTNSTVLISGLDMDAWRKPFGIMPQLMAMADSVTKLSAVCPNCQGKNGPAIFTQKKTSSQQLVEIGDEDIYEPRCRVCHTIPEPE